MGKKENGHRTVIISIETFRSSPPEVFLGKGVLKIFNKFTGEHPCRSVISIKLRCNRMTQTLHEKNNFCITRICGKEEKYIFIA